MAKISMLQYHASTVKTTVAANAVTTINDTSPNPPFPDNDTSVTVTLTDATKVEVNQLVQIDSEVLKITAISSNDVTFTRNQGGTRAAHADGAAVNSGLTSTAITLKVADASGLTATIGTSALASNQILKIDDEEMTISSISSNTITLANTSSVRDQANDTLASSHAIGTNVTVEEWTDAVITGTTATALNSMDLIDTLGNTMTGIFRVMNFPKNPFSGSAANSKGSLTGVFTDGMRIRVIDQDNYSVLFYGSIYDVDESTDTSGGFGSYIEIKARDFLSDFKDVTTSMAPSFQLDNGVNETSAITSSTLTPINREKNIWGDGLGDLNAANTSYLISTRSGILKSFIHLYSDNITMNEATTGGIGGSSAAELRWHNSFTKFLSKGVYKLGNKNNQSILKHINSLARDDPHSNLAVAGGQTFGYDYYLDPNFVDANDTYNAPKAFFNYAIRGEALFGGSPISDVNLIKTGLSIEYPTRDFEFEAVPLKNASDAAVLIDGAAAKADTSITLDANHTVVANRMIQLGDEQILVKTVSGAELTLVERGYNGTEATGYLTDTAVYVPLAINEDLDDSETAVTVHKDHTITANRIIQVDSESMFVSSVSTNVLTVIRGYNGSTATTHTQHLGLIKMMPTEFTTTGQKYAMHDPSFKKPQDEIFTDAVVAFTDRGQTKGSVGVTTHSEKTLDFEVVTISAAANETGGSYFGYASTTVTESIATIPRWNSKDITNNESPGTVDTTTAEWMTKSHLTTLNGNLVDTAALGSIQTTEAVVNDINHTTVHVDGSHGITAGRVIKLDSELMKVISVATNTLTVLRGYESSDGSTVAAHTDNEDVHIRDITLSVASNSDLNASHTTRDIIKIDSEQMLITAVSGDDLTVIRAYNGTSAAAHNDGATVYNVTPIARFQHFTSSMSGAAVNISESDPAHVLISEVQPNIGREYFSKGAVWRALENNGATMTILKRLKKDSKLRRTLKVRTESDSTPNTLRNRVATSLIRSTSSTVRGNFRTMEKPMYYVDSTVSAETDTSGAMPQTLTIGIDPTLYGIRIGTAINKLDSNSFPTSIYGYLSDAYTTGGVAKVKSNLVISNFGNDSIDAADVVRFFVRLRAGHLVYLKNSMANIAGKFLINKIHYTEQGGVANTTYDVVSFASALEEGGEPKSAFISGQEVKESTIPKLKTNSSDSSESMTDMIFSVKEDTNFTKLETALAIVKLNGSINTSITAVTIDDYDGVALNDVIRVDDEQMLVTAKPSSNVLTVTRDYNSSGNVNHLDDSEVWICQSYGRSLRNRVDWTAGTLVIGNKKYSIDAGTTASTMVTGLLGNNGDGGDQGAATNLAENKSYTIFYPGHGTSLKTIRTLNMTSSSDTGPTAGYFKFDEDDDISVATASYLKGGAEFNLLIKSMATNTATGGVGNSITSSSISEGALNEQKISLSTTVGQTNAGVVRTSHALERDSGEDYTKSPTNAQLTSLTAGKGVLLDDEGILAADGAGAGSVNFILDEDGATGRTFKAYPQTAGAPSYTFSGAGFVDTNTGMYSVGADEIGFSTAGTLRLSISDNGTKLDQLDSGTGTDLISDGQVIKAKTSSKRYKDNILDLDNINLNSLYDLRPVSFTWKNTEKNDFGLIAEEVNDIIPELVHYENDKPESVAYDKLSVLLLMEIKKLKDEIKQLKEK